MLITNQKTTLILGSLWIGHIFPVTMFKLSGLRLACMNQPNSGSIPAALQIFLVGGTRNTMSPKLKQNKHLEFMVILFYIKYGI